MKENQRKVFIGYFLLYSGYLLIAISLILIFIYVNLVSNRLNIFYIILFMVVVVVSFIFITFSSNYNILLINEYRFFIHPAFHVGGSKWFIQGVPNNKYSEFSLKINELINIRELKIYKIDKGIYQCEFNKKIIKFDMRGWIRKEYYIYEYILSIIQMETDNKTYKKGYVGKISNLKILFIRQNGKTKTYQLIKNNMTILNFLFRCRMKTKYNIISIYNKNGLKKIQYYYDFN